MLDMEKERKLLWGIQNRQPESNSNSIEKTLLASVPRHLSGTKLNRQTSLRGLNLVHLVFALATQSLLQPGGLIVLGFCGVS